MYSKQYTVYSIQYTVYSNQYTIYSLQFTFYILQSTVYSLQSLVYSRLLNIQHLYGIWTGLTPYWLRLDALSEYLEP